MDSLDKKRSSADREGVLVLNSSNSLVLLVLKTSLLRLLSLEPQIQGLGGDDVLVNTALLFACYQDL